jgi:allophanate hydrolase subunit 2
MSKLTLTQMAQAVGSADRLGLDQSQHLHEAFKKADEASRRSMRTEWIVQYLVKNLKVSGSIAEKIFEKSRDQRTKDQQSRVKRASDQFGYHISRIKGKATTSSQQDIVEKALNLVEQMTPAQLKRFKASI